MPAIARVLSSGFFIPADADNFVTSTKATVGLGLGLPTEIFCTTFTRDELDRFVNESAPEDSSDESAASPPLLPTRRPRRTPPTFSTEDEYHPMDTPSPSLRGAPFETYGWILESSAPAAPAIPVSSNQPIAHTNVGLGISLPSLNEPELVTTVSQRDTKVGLDLDLPCLASHELVTIIQPTSSNTGTDHSSFDEYAAAAPHSSCSSPSDECVSWTEVKAPTLERVIRRPTKECSPNLGFDSPFWRTYASVMAEKPLEVIYETA